MDNEEALELLKERTEGHYRIKEVKGAGRCIDFLLDDQSNTVFGKSQSIRQSWTRGDTTTPNETFRVRPCYPITTLVSHGAITFRGVNCVIYDHGTGKGDREFGLWLEYKFDADKVQELHESGKLYQITKNIM